MARGDRAGLFSAVRHKRFRPLWTASILSGVAYMAAVTACGWVAFDMHHHSSTVGFVVCCATCKNAEISTGSTRRAAHRDRVGTSVGRRSWRRRDPGPWAELELL